MERKNLRASPTITNLADPVDLLAGLNIRIAEQADLIALEWDGEYTHFRRLFADVYHQMQLGRALMWIAELPKSRLIGQLFISLNTSRPELADGKTRAYLFGFRVRLSYRNLGVGSKMLSIIELDLVDRGFYQLTLNVGQGNNSGREFYERAGYRVVGTDSGNWSYINDQGKRIDVNEPAWRMLKTINSKW